MSVRDQYLSNGIFLEVDIYYTILNSFTGSIPAELTRLRHLIANSNLPKINVQIVLLKASKEWNKLL